MTITIPTGDLVGILNDVIPMADPDKDFPSTHCVRLEWSSYQLHALATDRYHLGWATWEPDDKNVDEDYQPDIFDEWGGVDDSWSLTLNLEDAKHLVKMFKLVGKGVYFVPLTVEYLATGAVRIQRSKDTGHSAISTTVKDTFAEFPDVRGILAKHDNVEAATGFNFNAKRLASFAKVRPRGPLVMGFSGPDSLVRISIGERFVGAIAPTRDEERLAQAPNDILRDGSGVLLSTETDGDGIDDDPLDGLDE